MAKGSRNNATSRAARLSTADLLRESKKSILLQWEHEAREALPAARDTPYFTLLDSLPQFLDELAESLESRVPRLVSTSDIAEGHAAQRSGLPDFDLNQVLTEYSVLRQVILRQLEGHGGTALPARDRDIILDVVQRGKLAAAVRYTELSRQKELEFRQRLEANEAIHRATFDQAAVGMAHVGLDGRWLRVNQRLCEFLGYSPEELASLSFQEITHPEDLQGDLDLVSDLLAGRIPSYHLEKRYFRKDRRIVWAGLTVSLVRDASGDPQFFIAVVEDIDRRKSIEKALLEANRRAEETLSTLNAMIDSAPIGIAILDQELRYLRINSVLAEFNRKPVDAHLGKTIQEVLGSHPGTVISDLKAVLQTGRPVLNAENPDVSLDAEVEPRSFLANFFPLKHEGELRGIGAMVADITERRRNEKEKVQLVASLEQKVLELELERDLRERFVSSLTHDLRNPLAAARMCAQIILRNPSQSESVAGLAARIADTTKRADQMIQDLLDSSRVRAGQGLPIRPTDCDLAAIARLVCEEMTIVHGERFKLVSPDRMSGRWDGRELRRALENLVGNAIRYGDPTRPVTLRLEESAPEEVAVAVHNFGRPIPPEELPRLFGNFRRGTGSAGVRGWGIGLTLVRGVAEAHGGEISVRSSAAEGTTFTLRLPRQAAASSTA